MPVTICPVTVPKLADVAALRLFAVVVLPIVLLLKMLFPPVAKIPINDAFIEVVVPFVVIEPITLLEKFAAKKVFVPMPIVVPRLPEVVTFIEPVPVPLPMVLPAVVPTFTNPAFTKIPHHAPGEVEFVLEVVHTIFLMIFP